VAKAGLIGHPVEHSLSPTIFRFISEQTGARVGYALLDVGPHGLGDAVAQARGAGFAGLNVTSPHKVTALKLAHSLSREAEEIGAVNVLKFGREGTKGCNTDGPAVLDCLAGCRVSGKSAVVFGAGGAARAAVWALGKAGAGSVVVINRHPSRAKKLVACFSSLFPRTAFTSQRGASILDATIWVNATSASFRCPGDGDLAFDMVYRPARTLFLKSAAGKGLRCVYGLDMLIFQAMRSWELFFSRLPDKEGLRASLKRRLWRSAT
jgi:shikimate dehydrogenase